MKSNENIRDTQIIVRIMKHKETQFDNLLSYSVCYIHSVHSVCFSIRISDDDKSIYDVLSCILPVQTDTFITSLNDKTSLSVHWYFLFSKDCVVNYCQRNNA